jgi:hypothetical protein
MSTYTITITPDDPAQATATVRVRISDAQVRIDEVVMRAGKQGLTAHALQSIDLDLLTRAIAAAPKPRRAAARRAPAAEPPTAPARTARATSTDAAPKPPRKARATSTDAATEAAPKPARTARTTPTDPAVEAAPKPARTRRATPPEPPTAETPTPVRRLAAVRSAPQAVFAATPDVPAGDPAPRRATATAGPADRPIAAVGSNGEPKPRRAAKKSTAPEPAVLPGTGRTAYRQAPEDLADVLRQGGTIAAVADHYQVPHHTAGSWVRRLRKASAQAVR